MIPPFTFSHPHQILANISPSTTFVLASTLLHWSDAVGLGMIRSISPGQAASLPLGISSLSNITTNMDGTNVTAITTKLPTTTEIETPSIGLEVWLKIFAIGSNILLQLSPMRLVTDMQLKQSTGTLSPFPLIALTACGFQWSFYGYFAWSIMDNPGFLMLVYANILGFVLGLFYMSTYVQFCQATGWKSHAITWTIFLILEVLVCHVISNVNTSLVLSGAISALLSVAVSASPLAAVPNILKDNDLSSMPVDMVFASLLSSVLWLWCGYLLQDPWVWVPNFTGVVFGIVQLVIMAYVVQNKTKVS